RQPPRLEIAVVEIAAAADVRVVHQPAAHPFEVEGERERLAHARILELVAARVDEEGLKIADVPERQLGLDELARVEFLARLDARPFARREHPQEIELAR